MACRARRSGSRWVSFEAWSEMCALRWLNSVLLHFNGTLCPMNLALLRVKRALLEMKCALRWLNSVLLHLKGTLCPVKIALLRCKFALR